MVGGTYKDIEKKKAAQEQDVGKVAGTDLTRNLAEATGQSKLHVQEKYIDPPIKQAKENLQEDLSSQLNPEIDERKTLITQASDLLERARNAAEEGAKQASKTLDSLMSLIYEIKGQKISPVWQEQITLSSSATELQIKDPTNVKAAQEAQARLGTVEESSKMYKDLLATLPTNVPKARLETVTDEQADKEARILNNGFEQGLDINEIERQQTESRRETYKVFLTQLTIEGYVISQETLDKANIHIEIANSRSELQEAGKYQEALNAESYEAYTSILKDSGLDFQIVPPLLTSALLSQWAEGEAEMGAEAAATAQMIRDIEDMAREDQEQEDEMRKQLEEKERETDEAEEETTEEKKTAIEEMMEHIGELKSGPKEIPPGSGTFLGPFYPNPMEVVKQNNAKFSPEVMKTLVAKNFNETAFIAKKGEVDFSSDLTTPEAIVMSYLGDPENTEKKEAFVKVLEEPDNIAVRAALYEALAKTAVEISSA